MYIRQTQIDFQTTKPYLILFDANKNLWVGYWNGGITVFKPNDVELKVLKNFKTLDNNRPESGNVLYLYKTSDDQIWVGTWYSGLFKYEPASDRFIHYPVNDTVHNLNTCIVHKLFEDNTRNLWIGTQDEGLYKLYLTTNKIEHYAYNENQVGTLSSPTIFDIFQDSDNRLWVATENGLNLYDSTTNCFKSFFTDDGLPSNSIYSILDDLKGNLWLSSEAVISKVSFNETPKKLKFQSVQFDIGDGVQGRKFTKNSAFRTSDGQLYFGGSNGFNAFYPDSIARNQKPPQILITQLRINYKTITAGGADHILSKNIEYTKRIDLNYKQSAISFKFAVLN